MKSKSDNSKDIVNPITKSAKVTDLRVICRNFGLSANGSKKTILNRLYNHGAVRPTEKPPQDGTITKASKKEDLEKACRKRNLKTVGTKDELFRRLNNFKNRFECVEQNNKEIKSGGIIKKRAILQSLPLDSGTKQYSDYEMLQTSAQMSVKMLRFPKRHSGSILPVEHSIVEIVNRIGKKEKTTDTQIENGKNSVDSDKASFFRSLNLKPAQIPNTVVQLVESENIENCATNDCSDPLGDVLPCSDVEVLEPNEQVLEPNEHVLEPNEQKKIDENENFAINVFIDPLEVMEFTSAITEVTDTLEKYDMTFLTDSGFDEESNTSDSSDTFEDDSEDLDVDNLSIKKVIEFVEDAIENIVSVGAMKDNQHSVEKSDNSGSFFGWGSFQNESGSPEKVKFIL